MNGLYTKVILQIEKQFKLKERFPKIELGKTDVIKNYKRDNNDNQFFSLLRKPICNFGTQWKNCGQRPYLPANAKDVVCSGAYCAVICSDGYRSQDIWRIKCKQNNQWSQKAFSSCVTCSDIDISGPNIVSHVTYRRNLPSIHISCSDAIYKLAVVNFVFDSSKKMAELRCACPRNKTVGSNRQRKCEWQFRRESMNDLNPIQCISLDVPEIIPYSTSFSQDFCKFKIILANWLIFKFQTMSMKSQNYQRYFKC